MHPADTIIAPATGAAHTPVGIIRLSGPRAFQAALSVFRTFDGQTLHEIEPRRIYVGHIVDHAESICDQVILFAFAAPRSLTGEDVVEIQGHGNPHLVSDIIRIVMEGSVGQIRHALPGEFSMRAVINGKMSISQAEAVHELILADSLAAVRASVDNLGGRLTRIVAELVRELRQVMALLEASFEFAEEDIETLSQSDLSLRLDQVMAALQTLMSGYQTSQIMERGFVIALVGAPNVGKSSLLNALLHEDVAIVSPVAGTTRDVVRGSKYYNGVRVIFKDTAGLRDTDDVIEKIGISRTNQVIEDADFIFYLCDVHTKLSDIILPIEVEPSKCLVIVNKVDLINQSSVGHPNHVNDLCDNISASTSIESNQVIAVSALNGFNIENIENLIKSKLKCINVHNYVHINSRQFLQLEKSHNLLIKLRSNLDLPNEELIEELRQISSELEDIVGKITSDDVLTEIFSTFCIGK